MNLYFAPLEGIGGYIYRNAQADYFEKADKYYSPFLAPNQNRSISPKEYKDIAPEHNEDIMLVPQIMANNAEIFLKAAQELEQLGYKEINLNLGCPSRTVVTKYRGAGFLAKPDALEQFLEEVYSKLNIRLSLKTRLGMEDEEEFEHLLDIYNKFPVSELIIHPRVQKDFYKNQPNLGAFHDAVEESKIPLCYNGDIFTPESYEEMKREFPKVDTFMLGRGILMNPALLDLIRMREKTDVKKTTDIDVTEWKKEETSRKMQSADRYKKEIHAFLEQIKCDYLEVGMGEKNTLFKLKELWAYMGQNAPEAKKALKRIRKSQSMADYDSASREALEDFILF